MLEITAPPRGFEVVRRLVELYRLLQALNCAELFLLARQRAVSSASGASSSTISCSTSSRFFARPFWIDRCRVARFSRSVLVQLVDERFRLRIDFHPQAARRLVDEIDRLVGKIPAAM